MFKTTIIFNFKKFYYEIKNYIVDSFSQIIDEKFFLWFPVFVGIGIFITFDRFFYDSNYIYIVFLLPILLFLKKVRRVSIAVSIGVLIACIKLYFLADHTMLDHEIDFIKLQNLTCIIRNI